MLYLTMATFASLALVTAVKRSEVCSLKTVAGVFSARESTDVNRCDVEMNRLTICLKTV